MSEWLDLVKKTMKENPGLKFKEVLKIAKKNYKKSNSSGESSKKTIKFGKSKKGKKNGSSKRKSGKRSNTAKKSKKSKTSKK